MDDLSSKNYISWPILTLMAFVTVIGFDDIMYNFQNQGMTVITSWVLMLFLYVIPYFYLLFRFTVSNLKFDLNIFSRPPVIVMSPLSSTSTVSNSFLCSRQ